MGMGTGMGTGMDEGIGHATHGTDSSGRATHEQTSDVM